MGKNPVAAHWIIGPGHLHLCPTSHSKGQRAGMGGDQSPGFGMELRGLSQEGPGLGEDWPRARPGSQAEMLEETT